MLGLLGHTGKGKSTLARLLARLYDPDKGSVRLGGANLHELPQAELRRRIGVVTQEVQLFAGTLRENLTLYDPAISDEKVWEALAELGLSEWAESLPAGLGTELSGNSLSAGEAQLLAFARIFLKDPSLVIMDEASSRLDAATEQQLERAVSRLLRNRTAILIAHRLSTVRRADRIVVLEQGAVVEQGDRADLAADPGSRFSQLVRLGLEGVEV